MRGTLKRTRPLAITTSLAILLFSHAAVSQSDAPSTQQNGPLPPCPEWMHDASEFDVFIPKDKDSQFAPRDLATSVVTNTGSVPVKVTIKFFEEQCLKNPRNRDLERLPCRNLGENVVELYPGDQSTVMMNFGSGRLNGPAHKVAYRVLFEYMKRDSYPVDSNSMMEPSADPDWGADPIIMKVQIDLYRNLSAVDCGRIDGTPDFTPYELKRSLIQSIEARDRVSYNEYCVDLDGVSPNLRPTTRDLDQNPPCDSCPGENTQCERLSLPPRDYETKSGGVIHPEFTGPPIFIPIHCEYGPWDYSKDYIAPLSHVEAVTTQTPQPIGAGIGYSFSLQGR